ncbi:MAG: sugar phosphate isomerase/epimerase [Thermoguttaceae bacterium]|jgi:sugar phosphate isomerase/epimerase
MMEKIDRRHFLKSTGAITLGIGLMGKMALNSWSAEIASEIAKGAPNAEKLGWRLGCQAWSFNKFTLFEAIDKTASLGLKYIEAYPGQALSKDRSQIKVDESLTPDARKDLRKKLNDCGVKLVNYGVCNLSQKEDESRKTFDFAKDLGMETIVSEPAEQAMEMLDRLCAEYKMNIAIHNHPKFAHAHYWNPDTVLKACQGCSHRIGACADTGHWVRSGLDPLESLKKLEGRIVSLHFKDLNQKGPDAHDVPWGTGVCDVRAMLAELHRQKVKAVFSIEYEHNWDNSLPDIARCVEYIDKIAAELATGTNG